MMLLKYIVQNMISFINKRSYPAMDKDYCHQTHTTAPAPCLSNTWAIFWQTALPPSQCANHRTKAKDARRSPWASCAVRSARMMLCLRSLGMHAGGRGRSAGSIAHLFDSYNLRLSTGLARRCALSRSAFVRSRYRRSTVKSAWPMSRCRLYTSQPLRSISMAKVRRKA